MAITQAMCTSFKVELLNGIHAFGTTVARGGTTADTFNLALYTSSASLGAATTAYTTSNEVSGTGYTAKGAALTAVAPTSSSSFSIELSTAITCSSRFTICCLASFYRLLKSSHTFSERLLSAKNRVLKPWIAA